jgi:hypothetical protein
MRSASILFVVWRTAQGFLLRYRVDLTDHIAIGMLSGLIHRDIVDDVLNECRKREKRSRLLPAHVVVYYVLALNLR